MMDEVEAAFFGRYQDAWDATMFDCPLCGNQGVFWTVDNDGNEVAPERCDCAAGVMLPPSAQIWLAGWPGPIAVERSV